MENLVNPQANYNIEIIHQVIVNFIQMYNIQENLLDKDDMCKGILADAEFYFSSKIIELETKLWFNWVLVTILFSSLITHQTGNRNTSVKKNSFIMMLSVEIKSRLIMNTRKIMKSCFGIIWILSMKPL